MPIAHSEVIEFLKPGLDTAFFKMFDTYRPAPGEANALDMATVIPSTTYQNKYAALGSAPMLQKTRAEIARRGAGPVITYTIDNVDYDGTIEFHKNDLSDDQYGIIVARSQELGSKARQSIDKWTFQAIHAGATNLCYDKLSLFNDAHVSLGTSMDNNLDLALSKANLSTAITTMQRYVDDNGEPAGILPDLLLVNPALFVSAWEIVYGTSLIVTGLASTSSASVGMNANGIGAYGLRVLQSPYLSSDTEWYIASTRYPIKPIIVQEREPVTTDMSDKDVFDNGMYKYKATWRGNTGYYDWRTILRGQA